MSDRILAPGLEIPPANHNLCEIGVFKGHNLDILRQIPSLNPKHSLQPISKWKLFTNRALKSTQRGDSRSCPVSPVLDSNSIGDLD